jgi:choloylglycine hydrolase
MGIEEGGFPLIFDGVNEFGVAAAGLNFPRSARFYPPRDNFMNLASHELIPYILASSKSVADAYDILTRVNITADKFNTDTPIATLHFMVADKTSSIIAEQGESGMKIYEDVFGTLTNEPSYPIQCLSMHRFRGISNSAEPSSFISSPPLSYGEGSVGLPGDLSSPSRFARAAFGIKFAVSSTKEEALSTAMHILESVSVIKGTVADGGEDYKTRYVSIVDTENVSYYYKRYGDIKFFKIDLSDSLNTTLR